MDQYAIIGNPVQHSLSPTIHKIFAEQTDQIIAYTRIKAPIDRFADTVNHFISQGGKGCSITLPFKEAAYQLATTHSSTAKAAGAANTLIVKGNHEIYADNTDGPGLIQDLTNNHHYCLQQKNILIIGAGGVVREIIQPLLSRAPRQLHIANRTPEKAYQLANDFKAYGNIKGWALDDIPPEPVDLMINATSASVSGQVPDISSKSIGKQTWCYDLFYSDQATAFLQWAQQFGAAQCLDGLGMLVEQAALQFYLWRGVHPETQSVIQQLK
jgi:shikimate dehydrogenase